MTLPSELGKCIETLRTQVRQLNIINRNSFGTNVTTELQTARSYVVTTNEIDRALEVVMARCGSLLAEVDLFATDKTLFQNAQQQAFTAIDDLERALEGVKSSQQANILGIGWS